MFIGAGAIILPGVTIGKKTIVGAGAVVSKSIAPGSVVAGNPAHVIGNTEDYLSKHLEKLKTSPTFKKDIYVTGKISKADKRLMRLRLKKKPGYLVK